MRDIYINRMELGLKANPKEVPLLTELRNPELFINPGLKIRKYPQDYSSYMDPSISGIICKLLLVNKARDGIWLTIETDKDKVSIPGGHVNEFEWDHYVTLPYECILNTICRELVEEHLMLRNGEYNLYNLNPDDLLIYVVSKYGFTINPKVNFPLYYSYDHNGDLIIYVVKEVDMPDYNIPALSNFIINNSIWYSKKDHMYNIKAKIDRSSLFNSPYKNDIRVSMNGIGLLDKIFSTENLFGKMNIY